MSLLFDSMEDMVFMEKTREPDGMGGFHTAWREGETFQAAIVFSNSIEARVGQKMGVSSLYTVTLPQFVPLEYHDVFKRVSDGKIFRVTSDGDDIKTPSIASFSVQQVTAEEWTLS